jgi:histidinol-phosphate phosphatase family protein
VGPPQLRIVPGAASGPAAARNRGWHASDADWVAFLDDDVAPPPGWVKALRDDIAACGDRVAASQGRIRVPLPLARRPSDAERNVAGLAGARFATADMAYRRAALVAVGGFDERFPRAYREDADLALRVMNAGYEISVGKRVVDHPPGPVRRFASLQQQAGNADDALMRRLHGPGWRRRIGGDRPLLARHALTTAAVIGGIIAAAAGRRRTAMALGAAWLALTAGFAYRRIAPGPRGPLELADMLVTSILIPPLATFHRVRGEVRWRGVQSARGFDAVLFDRDGTVVDDVPYNGDPDLVRLRPGARQAIASVRRAGIPFGIVSNQSGIARGLLTANAVAAVNHRIEELVGPVPVWAVCPHGPDDGCDCRKPAPGLIIQAARRLGVPPERCVVIGDIGSDVEAARAAGARAILIPTKVTRPEEVAAAPEVAFSLTQAVERLLGTSK